MAYVKNYGGNWQTGAGGGTPITEAALDNLETQYDEGKTDLDSHKVNQAAGDGRHRWTANKLLKGAGAAAPTEIDVPLATTEIYSNVFYSPAATPMETSGAPIAAGGCFGLAKVKIPPEATSIVSVEAIIKPLETGASMHFDFRVDYGQYNGGEAWNVHTDTASAVNVGATVIDRYLARNITAQCGALAAGDILLVWVIYNATAIDSNANFVGIRVVWS